MTQANDLKGCPVCGKQPEYAFLPEQGFGEWDTHSITCFQPNHHHVQVIDLTKQGAVFKWNTRPADPVKQMALEALRNTQEWLGKLPPDITAMDIYIGNQKALEAAAAEQGGGE